MTPMERELLRTVGRLQAETEEREQRLTEQISSLTARLDLLMDKLQRLGIVCDNLVGLLDQV